MRSFDIQLERNLKGIKLEKLNEIDQAIELYEKNVEENFEGNHPKISWTWVILFVRQCNQCFFLSNH